MACVPPAENDLLADSDRLNDDPLDDFGDDPDDPDGADREIESIVQMIEAGII